jgi:hypothetical protein
MHPRVQKIKRAGLQGLTGYPLEVLLSCATNRARVCGRLHENLISCLASDNGRRKT